MSLGRYIQVNFDNDLFWFADEVKKAHHLMRVSKVLENKNYIKGIHKVLNREDMEYKGEKYVTRKIVLQTAKTIMNFHSTYLLGKPVSLVGSSEGMVKEFNRIYRQGNFNSTDFKIVDKINKYGDVFEYVYMDGGKIKSKLINSEDAYPVYSDGNEYIAFIEHYVIDSISYYTVFTEDKVLKWNNEHGEFNKVEEYANVSGLPIHYHNLNDDDEMFGKSELEDIKGILDEMEDILSKFSDSIYTNSLNPMPVVSGQRIDSTIPADAMGYVLNLEDGADYKVTSTMLDYNSIKLLYDTLKQSLLEVAGMPSIAMGQGNIANVSETSLKMLYQMADVKAMLNERYVREGMNKRFEVIRDMIGRGGMTFGTDDYVDVEFDYARPINVSDLLDNLGKQHGMGAISGKTVIEKSPLTNNVEQEIGRLREETGDIKKKEEENREKKKEE
ncbi:phage portal protein, SPP1 [Alkaliphilus metalliredigens QYMF]|uniref:Phage portal protein, SPP1 n=1 Tax=Alkaliphilus metalliredigens (strain QYMF) TaxID=293826 RepID=A6TS18_ALKMQ|nr:phage portal protein [Alkaliphilus metalliredigens]ABR48986.1 phage portal protein, SPP1 [Alkaliphilus metalliredigens QYMF]